METAWFAAAQAQAAHVPPANNPLFLSRSRSNKIISRLRAVEEEERSQGAARMKMTIVYDNEVYRKGLGLICPTHCTQHMEKTRRLYPDKYVGGGVGQQIQI